MTQDVPEPVPQLVLSPLTSAAIFLVVTIDSGGAVTVQDEVQGFKYFDERDLLGFVDGTENPTGAAARAAVLVGDEEPGQLRRGGRRRLRSGAGRGCRSLSGPRPGRTMSAGAAPGDQRSDLAVRARTSVLVTPRSSPPITDCIPAPWSERACWVPVSSR